MTFPKPDGVVYEGWRRSAVARRAWEHRWGVNIICLAEEKSPCFSVRGRRDVGWDNLSLVEQGMRCWRDVAAHLGSHEAVSRLRLCGGQLAAFPSPPL